MAIKCRAMGFSAGNINARATLVYTVVFLSFNNSLFECHLGWLTERRGDIDNGTSNGGHYSLIQLHRYGKV